MKHENHSQKRERDAYEAVLRYLKTVHAEKNSPERISAWSSFKSALQNLEISKDFKEAVTVWTLENLENHHPETIRVRDLHQMESFIITPQAHGKLLEAMRYGMISLPQGEEIIDEMILPSPENSESEIMGRICERWAHNAGRFRGIRYS